LIATLICCACIAILYRVYAKKQILNGFFSVFVSRGFVLLLLRGILFSSISLLMLSITLSLLIGANTTLKIGNVPIIIAASTGSWLIGFLTPGVPGGMGVRETAIVLMLSPTFFKETILTAAVLQRLAMIVGDVLAWALSAVWACKSESPHSRTG
jgi:hypothetical protein